MSAMKNARKNGSNRKQNGTSKKEAETMREREREKERKYKNGEIMSNRKKQKLKWRKCQLERTLEEQKISRSHN